MKKITLDIICPCDITMKDIYVMFDRGCDNYQYADGNKKGDFIKTARVINDDAIVLSWTHPVVNEERERE